MALAAGAGARSAGGGPRGHALQNALVTTQVAAALVLLVSAGLLLRSYARLSNVDPGVEPEGVMTALVVASIDKYPDAERRRLVFGQIVERVAAVPGVHAVGLCDCMPPDNVRQNGSTMIEGRIFPEGQTPITEQTRVDPGYFAALRVPIRAGRAFTPADRDGTMPVAVVNETFARRLLANGGPPERALGQRVSLDGEYWMTVVGVAADVRYAGLAEPAAPSLYYAFAQDPFPGMNLFVRTSGDPMAIVPAVGRAVLEVDRDLPLARVASLATVVGSSLAAQRLNTTLLATFAGLAAALAIVGIYGVVAYGVARRRREMGVRLALGAQPADVVRLAVWRGLRPVGMGILIGVGLAALGSTVLAHSLYATSPHDPVTYAAVAAAFVAVSTLAAYAPARRAATANPVEALRGD